MAGKIVVRVDCEKTESESGMDARWSGIRMRESNWNWN